MLPRNTDRWAFTCPRLPKLQGGLGYTISSVNGTRFFNDARDVNGSLVSTYQSPYVNVAYTVRKNWIWNAQYNYFGYGEGGPSGAANLHHFQYASDPGNAGASSSLQLSHTGRTSDRFNHIACWGDRAAELPCKQCNPRNALRLLSPHSCIWQVWN